MIGYYLIGDAMNKLDELRKVRELRGDTYSSAEVIGLVDWSVAEIERLRAALTKIDNESNCDIAAKIAQEALADEQKADGK